jgi:hypothetical protein
MTTEPDGDETAAIPMTECRVCQTHVPDGEFCGLCGAHLTPQKGDGPDWLRIHAFGAAPNEHLLRPALTSSLFPHLPQRSFRPFRVALVVVLVMLVVAALLRMPALLIALAALGIPLLFMLYLQEVDVHRDVPVGTLVLTAALGVGLGVGWVMLTGTMVARSYGVGLETGIAGYRMLREGVGVPIGGLILMLVPALVVRVVRPGTREALDGFMIGALGALTFTAAATLTRLAPQFATGLVNRSRPMAGLLVEAGIRGLAVPVMAAAAGGLLGAVLWFRRPPSKAGQRQGFVRLALALFTIAVLVLYAGLGLLDVARVPQVLQLVVYLAVAAVAVLVLRVGLHLALLHEEHDEIQAGKPIVCAHCGHVVPDMAFCPACGVATRASSRSSRTARREKRPARSDGGDT